MNLKEIREIVNLMNENDLSEIEVEREGTKIKIRKSAADAPVSVISSQPAYHIESQPKVQSAPVESPAQPAADSNSNLKGIVSPMVGTFYRSPSPDAPSFVEVGDVVEVGQVVCIVEAMKLMNEIKSEVKGKIVEAPVDNAQPVEFGQVLFGIEPV